MQPSLARELGAEICSARDAPIAAAARQWAASAFADTVGVALGAATEPAARILLGLPGMGAAEGAASNWLSGTRTDPLDAALVNGTAAHALDYDDCATASMLHPSAVLVPAILALGEHLGASGPQAITAYAVGLEAALRIGGGLVPEHLERGWHPSATIGIFGATAAAATLLALDPDRTATALGIAGSLAGGIGGNIGSMTKPLHCGQAARHAVMAALLAAGDFTARPQALEGRNGFFDVFNGVGRHRAEAMLGGWMDPPLLETTEIGPKLYPCCGSTHSSIALALQLRREHGPPPEAITAITIGINPTRLRNIDRPDPRDALEAKFSLHYVVCRALRDGAVRLADFEDGAWNDPGVRALMAVTRTAGLADGETRGPVDFRSVVTLTLADGSVLSASGETGEWRGPTDPLPEAEAWTKFADCAARAIPPDAARTLFDGLRTLDEVADLRLVLAPLASRHSTPSTPHQTQG